MFLPVIRLVEPFFFRILWRKLKLAFGCCKRGNDDKEVEEEEEIAPLFAFLTSSLNVELVYIILKGITQFSYINKGPDFMSEKKSKNITLVDPAAEDATIILKKIKIKNVDQWSRTASTTRTESNATEVRD